MALKSKLCTTFQALSLRLWADLRDAADARLSLGEESITDYILLELLRRHSTNIKVTKFPKAQEGKKTGADWEWWIGSPGKWFPLRVQAKRLDSQSLRYKELNHTVTVTKKRQVDLLIRDAKANGLFPIYCFYNHLDDAVFDAYCPASQYHFLFPSIVMWSCCVASAYLVKQKIAARSLGWKDIGSISLPWTILVCDGFHGSLQPSSLGERARQTAEILVSLPGMTDGREKHRSVPPTIPPLVENLPPEFAELDRGDLTEVAKSERFANVAGIMIINDTQ